MPDDELKDQMWDDLYDGLADEISEGTNILLSRGWSAKKVLDDSGYQARALQSFSAALSRIATTPKLPPPQFGDLTKGAIKGFEGQVRSATGNEEYKFGSRQTSLVAARP